MSTIFTKYYDSPALTRPIATSVVPTQAVTTGSPGILNQDQLVPFVGRYRFPTITGNLGTLSSLGTSTTVVADKTYYADIFIPLASVTLTGIGFLNGTTATTDKAIVSLYDSAGTLLANSLVTGGGTLIATSNVFQQLAFTAAYITIKPGRYWIGYQQNGTTATPRTIATATWIDVLTGSATGVNAVAAPTITPPTTFTADVGPVAYAY
jgi:hypothetical protein